MNSFEKQRALETMAASFVLAMQMHLNKLSILSCQFNSIKLELQKQEYQLANLEAIINRL